MTRLIEADELFGELCENLEEDEDTERGWVDIEAIVQAFNHAPTVHAVPVSFIESEIKRMDNQIKRALKDDDDEWAERAIIRKLTLEFTLAKWMAEREEE